MPPPRAITPEIAARICELLEQGASIESACALTSIEPATYRRERSRNSTFRSATTRARAKATTRIEDRYRNVLEESTDAEALRRFLTTRNAREYSVRHAEARLDEQAKREYLQAFLDGIFPLITPSAYAEIIRAIAVRQGLGDLASEEDSDSPATH